MLKEFVEEVTKLQGSLEIALKLLNSEQQASLQIQNELREAHDQIAALTVPEWLKVANAIFKTGLDYVGMPYVWGAEYPKGFDCSAFTQRVFAKNGIKLLRTSYQQVTQGEEVARENTRKGDLVFFKFKDGPNEVDHVGIADGQDNMLQTNDPDKPIRISPIPSVGYVTTKRVTPD